MTGLQLSLTDVLVSVGLFLVILAMIAFATRNWWVQRGHGQSLAALASDRGLQYVPRDDRQVRAYGFPFGVGHGQRAENVLFGQIDGRKVLAYDYVFEVEGRRRPVRFSAVFVRLPVALPELEVVEEAPERFLGIEPVRFGSDEFDGRFHVRAAERKLAHAIVHPRTMLALMACKQVAVRIQGAEALSWKRGRLGTGDLDRHLAAIAALIDGIPQTVWTQHRRTA